ncbi:spore germination protein [Salipaludibacillus daqingensis]|uniref:spore germination protein n=1 Tax=Salipaludibacillus daqingensis TaxID=3041001 RepID=UPI0024737858|nr:spore germination protein [Salipaludibacillus daqingensis]
MSIFDFWRNKKKTKEEDKEQKEKKSQDSESLSFHHVLNNFDNCADFNKRTFTSNDGFALFFASLLNTEEFERDVIRSITKMDNHQLREYLAQEHFEEVTTNKDMILGIVAGSVGFFLEGKGYLIEMYGPEGRSIEESETETVITGPHDGFVESAGKNVSLIRKRVRSSHLKCEKMVVGEVSKSEVYFLYIKDIANDQIIEEMKRRVENIETDGVFEANTFVQILEDSPNSVFPQFQTTERPDVACSKLLAGKLILAVDSSPAVISAPSSFVEFFQSPDDYYNRWVIGSSIRLLRFVSFIITILFTALYVSATTFHYEIIPDQLLIPLAESRKAVPFPPIIEALLMEFTIELLREAGARLPTKVGQTIGIVGGIVIGQAAVAAGFTSDILIIAVATSAIASFVIPSYIMSGSIRLIRFGFIILAGILGNIGIVIGITVVAFHLATLTSINKPYLTPITPLILKDFKDVFLRAPYWAMTERPNQADVKNKIRTKVKE